MSGQYRNVSLPTVAARISENITISGQVELEHPTSRIIMTDGHIELNDSVVSDGKVSCSGKLYFNCICEDNDGKLYSFCASADFSDDFDCEDAKSGMKAEICASVSEIKAEMSGNIFTINAEADLFGRIEEITEIKMLTSSEGTEISEIAYTYMDRECVGKNSSYVREDIAAGNIKSVVFADASAVVRDITTVIDNARVDGIMSLNALCINKDGSYEHLRQNIPFSIEAETKYDNCKDLSATVSVTDVRLRMTEEEYGLATVDAQIHVELFASSQVQIKLTDDAFSPSEPFGCIKKKIPLLLFRENTDQKNALKADVHINNMQDFSEAVFCSVRPLVSNATKSDEQVVLDGLLYINLIYLDKSGKINTSKQKVPFSVGIPLLYESIEIDAYPVCTSVNYGTHTDKGIELNVTLSTAFRVYELKDVETVIGTEPAKEPDRRTGFIVCFANDGETAYDIAKSFGISRSSLKEANPDLGDVLHSGDKAILIR